MSEGPGRTVVVTGAARGIGAGVAKRLAEDGLAVAILDLLESEANAVAGEIRAAGGRAMALGCDISNEGDVQASVDAVAKQLGPPTVLVNNAGITRDNLLFKMSVDDWDAVMAVHLRGAFLASRATQQYMVEARWGRIVSLSSVGAYGNRGQANYSAAKAGLQGFSKTLALELGQFGITSNCIAPGFVESEMTRATAARTGVSFDEFRSLGAAQAAVGRVGQPSDIAAVTSFLVSDEAGFVSGQVINVAGGP